MKKYRKHYYVKGMNTKYLTPLVCSPRMVQAPHSTSSQEPVLPGAMKEWRKDRDTENLGSVGHDSLVKTPQSPRLNIIYIIYNWAGRQSYCTQLAEEAGLSNLCRNSQQSSEGQKKPWWVLSAYTVNIHTQTCFTIPRSLTWRKLWHSHGSCVLGMAMPLSTTDTRDFPWSFQLIYVDGNHESS